MRNRQHERSLAGEKQDNPHGTSRARGAFPCMWSVSYTLVVRAKDMTRDLDNQQSHGLRVATATILWCFTTDCRSQIAH